MADQQPASSPFGRPRNRARATQPAFAAFADSDPTPTPQAADDPFAAFGAGDDDDGGHHTTDGDATSAAQSPPAQPFGGQSPSAPPFASESPAPFSFGATGFGDADTGDAPFKGQFDTGSGAPQSDDDEEETDDHEMVFAIDDAEGEDRMFSSFFIRDKINFMFEGIPPNFVGIDELQPWLYASRVITHASLFIVFVSCINFAVDTLPQFWGKNNPVTFGIEAACIAWFTVELTIRFATSRDKKHFFLKALNVVDLVAILPFYIDVIFRAASSSADRSASRVTVLLLLLRFTRLSRVIKLSKHSLGMSSIWETISRSQAALSLMFFLLTICLIVGASAIYFSEQTVSHWDADGREWKRNRNDEPSPFQSIFHAMWFALVTITTVGYGDDRVESALGKIADVVLMLFGVFVIAFPTVILSSNFHDIHNSRLAEREQLDEKVRRLAAEGLQPMHDDGDDDDDDDGTNAFIAAMQARRRGRQTVLGGRQSFSYVLRELNKPALEYRIGQEPARGVYINNFCAEYAPLLSLQREQSTDVPEKERPFVSRVQSNYPVGIVVTFILLLHTKEAQDAAESAVRSCLGETGKLLTVRPKLIKALTVSWKSPHPHLSGCKVVTRVFNHPIGQVPLQLYLPYFDALPAFVRYNAGAAFRFDIEYEEPLRATVKGTSVPVGIRAPGKRRGSTMSQAPGTTPPSTNLAARPR